MHLVHEAALCVSGIRHERSLSQKGFELANGLPFVPTEMAIHELLKARTVEDAQKVQIALGKIRRASGHFPARLLAVDPHRIRSFSKRQARRHRFSATQKAEKMAQTFFCLDAESSQPVCFLLSSAATTVSQATAPLLELTQTILNAGEHPRPLVLADSEHYSRELLDEVRRKTPFDLLLPMPAKMVKKGRDPFASDRFKPRWAGFATTKAKHHLKSADGTQPWFRFTQRTGERSAEYQYKSFLSTADRDEVEDLAIHYPQRWHIEEFFKFNQALGWKRAGTLNLNIRYGQMTMSLIAQAAIHQMRTRLDKPYSQWDASHLAKDLFGGIEGDLRVKDDTVIVTFYNAPNAELFRKHYENLPDKLQAEGIDPRLPWLYDFKLDFQFR
jgi:hypothetical protein